MYEINVSLFRPTGSKIYYMQYRDPVSGCKIRRTSGTNKRRDAERLAAKWEKDLSEGKGWNLSRITWEEFRLRYEDEVCGSFADTTNEKVASVFNVLERAMKPRLLSSVNEDLLSRYQAWLREHGRRETTIKSHLDHLMAALNWAVDQKLLRATPKVKKPKRAKRSKVMKGRPITLEEFERMLDKVPAGVLSQCVREERRTAIVESWRFYLRGLWASGLRLEESTQLHWTNPNKLCVVDLDKAHPMLLIPGELEKGNEDRILPMAPEFAELLRRVPTAKRTSYVFNPLALRNRYYERLTAHRLGKVVSKIGKAAGVKVDGSETQVKYASAHDLRRSFGARWSQRVMPAVLQELMRHESIQTTMKYYVGRNAQSTAAALWEASRLAERAGGQVGYDFGYDPETPFLKTASSKGE